MPRLNGLAQPFDQSRCSSRPYPTCSDSPVAATGSGMPQPPAGADPEATGVAVDPRAVGAAARHVAAPPGGFLAWLHPSLAALFMLNSSPSASAAMGFASRG